MDRFKLGSSGMVSLEAIASGRLVITYVSLGFSEYGDFPLKNVKTEENIIGAFEKPMSKLWEAQHSYLMKNHIPDVVLKKLLDIYESLI